MADSVNKSFFDALLDVKAAKWSAGVAFDRSNPLPLDQWSVFKTKADAEAYLSNAKAYPGQIIAYAEADVMEGETLKKAGGMVACVLSSNEAGTGLELKQIGIIPTGDDKTIEVSADGAIALMGAATAANGTLPMIEEVDGKQKLVWKTLEDIGAGDGNDNTTYEFAFADQKITITPKFNGVAQAEQVLDLTAFVTANELEEVTGEVPEGKTLIQLIEEAQEAAEKYADDNDTNTEYHIEYDSNKKEIKLVAGANAEKMTIDATPFIKDGMLHDVEYDAEAKELVFTWNTDAGKTEDRVPVDELVNVYTAGDGLKLDNNSFSVQIDEDLCEGYLNKGENGIYIEGVDLAIENAIEEASKDLKDYFDKEDKNTTYTLSDSTKDADKVQLTLTPTEGSAQTVDVDAYSTDAIDAKLFEGKYSYTSKDEVVEVTSNIPEDDQENSRLITPEEMFKLTALEILPDNSGAVIPAGKVRHLDDKIKVVVTSPTNPEEGMPAGLGIEKGAQVNKIETVKVNGTALTADNNKAVDIIVPTDVKDLADADKKYITNVRMREEQDGYKPVLQANKTGSEVVLDDSALQLTIKGVKDTADTAVQTAKFAGTAFAKNGTEISISQADARTALGLGSAAYKDEDAFAPAGNYKTKQTAVTNKITDAAHVLTSLTQNANGEVEYEVKKLTPADIGAQPVGDYQPAGNYKVKQTAKIDPTAEEFTGTVLSYIDSLTQNENGEITATKKSFDVAGYIQEEIGKTTNIMNFRGVIDTTAEGFDEKNPFAQINNPENGDVVLYGAFEYIYDGKEWKEFGDATGSIATAKAYTDEQIAKIHTVDNDTIKLNESKQAYVAKVSTDVLVQGEQELVLCGGNAFGFASN